MNHHAESGSIRADLAVAVVATAVVLGLGVLIGAAGFGGAKGATQTVEAARLPAPQEAPAPTLQTAARTGELERRLAALEKSLDALRSAQASTMDQLRPVLEDYERKKREGAPPTIEPSLAPVGLSGQETTAEEVRKIGRKLGLDASLREAMAGQLAQTLAEIEALEKANAEVSRDGAVTTIRIAKYGDRASGALRRWHDWLERNLGPRERDAYERDRSDARLLGVRAGLFERTVRIDESSGAIQVTEAITTSEGQQPVFQANAPALARDLILEPYDHLLSGATGR